MHLSSVWIEGFFYFAPSLGREPSFSLVSLSCFYDLLLCLRLFHSVILFTWFRKLLSSFGRLLRFLIWRQRDKRKGKLLFTSERDTGELLDSLSLFSSLHMHSNEFKLIIIIYSLLLHGFFVLHCNSNCHSLYPAKFLRCAFASLEETKRRRQKRKSLFKWKRRGIRALYLPQR